MVVVSVAAVEEEDSIIVGCFGVIGIEEDSNDVVASIADAVIEASGTAVAGVVVAVAVAVAVVD